MVENVNDNLSILGLDEFDEKEKRKIIEYSEKYVEKIFRDIRGTIKVHAKKHKKGGKRAKYSFHVRMEAPETLISVRGNDWILATALHKVFTKVENKIQHKFKTKGHKTGRK
jgi:predicted RNA-binding protein Jag